MEIPCLHERVKLGDGTHSAKLLIWQAGTHLKQAAVEFDGGTCWVRTMDDQAYMYSSGLAMLSNAVLAGWGVHVIRIPLPAHDAEARTPHFVRFVREQIVDQLQQVFGQC
jgi:hypothetical protein